MKTQEIEFIGGPFDGYEFPLSLAPEKIANTVTLPLNENVHRMLGGQPPGPKAPARTVAIYRLDRDEERYQYRFIGAALAKHFEMGRWRI